MLTFTGWSLLAFASVGTVILLAAVLAAAIGALIFIRSRGNRPAVPARADRGEKRRPARFDQAGAASSHTEPIQKDSNVIPPTKADLAQSASDDAGNFSKSYSESLDILHLPIGRIDSIEEPFPIEELGDSEDEGLLAAIDEIQDDTDADSEFRLIALRVLASFKNRNSIEALSQIALYDLSTTLRSKAVVILADFDHESVFEPIVLACADPSREVRAAGARALVKITFDRADAWTRLALSEDRYLSRQIARAAVEAGIAERSFDRLVLNDEKAVHEAFALVYLLISTGETDKLFETIREHRDVKTRIALLHAIKVANIAEVIPHLTAFIAAEPLGSPVADLAREALLSINAIPVPA